MFHDRGWVEEDCAWMVGAAAMGPVVATQCSAWVLLLLSLTDAAAAALPVCAQATLIC